MDWILWTTGGIILIGFLMGIYRGAVRIAVSMMTAVLTLTITFIAAPYATAIVEEKTPLDDSIKESIVRTMENVGKALLGIEEESEESEELWENVTEESELPRDIQIQAIEMSELPEVFKELLTENNNDEIYDELGVETFVQYVGAYLSHLMIHIACFLALFLLVTIILRAIVFALNIVNEIPVFGIFNRLAGGLLGALFSLVAVWFIFILILLFYETEIGRGSYEMIMENDITRLIMEYNPLLKLSIKM